MKSLIFVATASEGANLRDRLIGVPDVRVIETGVGPVNAAHAATVAILAERPDEVISVGIGGAYPSSGLRIGDVACAATEIYGDLGADSPSGFLDMAALGFPVILRPEPLYNELPLQVFPTANRVRFVTVSKCTGTDLAAREVEQRTGGAIENMEGAAIAHVAHIYGIPMAELRGVSNIVRNRDRNSWRIPEAAAAAQEVTAHWLAQCRLR